MKKRTKLALCVIASSFALSAVLGLLHAVMPSDKPFFDGWIRATEICYLLFGGGAAAAGVLLLITTIPSDLAYGFGNGLHYGTLIMAGLLQWLIGPIKESYSCIVALVIVSLICYIVYIRRFKSKYEES